METVNAAGLWPCLIDPSQLENAILNLCINARDAMPDGGKITIEMGNCSFDRRTAKERGLEPGQYVSLCVSDTGVGMTSEVQAQPRHSIPSLPPSRSASAPALGCP